MCGRTSLATLGALLARCDVLVTGDTGPMHLAVAVGTPVVALFFGPALPMDTERHLDPDGQPAPVEPPVAHSDLEPEIEPPGAESPPLEDEPAESQSVEEPIEEPIEGPIEQLIEDHATGPDDEPAAESTDDETAEWEAVTAPPDPTPLAKKSAARRKQRPSMPSWDDIMFGTKRD